MSVESISQIAAGRNGGLQKEFQRDYTVVFRAIVTSPYDGPATLIAALQAHLGHVVLYTAYVGYENQADALALCVGIKPEPFGGDGEWKVWRLTLSFTTNWRDQQQQQQNPEDEPPIFWIETEFEDSTTTKEYHGANILNSAGQLLAGIPKRLVKQTYVWERNYNFVNTSVWKDFNNSVNADQVLDIEPKQGRLAILVPKPEYRNGIPFYRVQFRADVNEDGWTVEPADLGNAVKGSDGNLHRPIDTHGNPMDGEVPLKEDGTQQRDANAPIRYLRKMNIYKPRAWSSIGLPFI